MIEHLFITSGGAGSAAYTPAGLRHRSLLAQYADLMPRLAAPLLADCARSAPHPDAWSPYGALYGFASNLLELIAFRTLARDALPQFGIEDVFTDGDARKREWAEGWRRLPHIRPEIAQQFAFPQEFAEATHARLVAALQRRASGVAVPARGRLLVGMDDADASVEASIEASVGASAGAAVEGPAEANAETAAAGPVSELPPQFVVSSDPQWVAAGSAVAKDEADLLHCRNEGEYLVSFASGSGWTAVTTDLLSDAIGNGRDARIASLPATPAAMETSPASSYTGVTRCGGSSQDLRVALT